MPSGPSIATQRRGLLVFAPAVVIFAESIALEAERTELGAWSQIGRLATYSQGVLFITMPNGALWFIRLSFKTEHAAVRTESTLGSVLCANSWLTGARCHSRAQRQSARKGTECPSSWSGRPLTQARLGGQNDKAVLSL